MKNAVESREGGERSMETRRGGCRVEADGAAAEEEEEGLVPLLAPEEEAAGHQAEGGEE